MKRMYWIFVIVIVLAIVLVSVWWIRGKNALMEQHELRVGNRTYIVEIADTIPLRTQGLSGRDKLEEGHGMLFVFGSLGEHPFWMKDMKFPLDFVWINGDRVVGTTERVPAPAPSSSILSLPNYHPPEPIDKMLEINAGEVAKWGIQVGDKVEIGN
ncbi:MAG: DUF192 domain-containing protein [Candidatus Liptonbacteria bacterium]|nr:DUF192 domain-containing protein [Candidatus Liptonbacteria bacterium]